MATSTSSVSTQVLDPAAKIPLWLWPNLLSLDAPWIASLWQSLFARDAGVRLSLASRAALPLAVWLIYLVDRLLDTADSARAPLTARHQFYRVHRTVCSLLAALVACLCAVSIVFLPTAVFKHGMVVLGAVAAYLVLVHAMGRSISRWLPKEAVVGLIFAVGAVLSPLTRSNQPLRLVFPALLFGILCWTNSAAIEIWEGGRVDRVSTLMVRHIGLCALGICILGAAGFVFFSRQYSWAALVFTALGYCVVDYLRPQLTADLLRVSIDVPLLAPLLLFGVM